MQAIREIKKVSGRKVTIDLPDSFNAKEIEIIVIPYQQISSADKKNDWKSDFLSISQWKISEDDIRIKSWPLTEL